MAEDGCPLCHFREAKNTGISDTFSIYSWDCMFCGSFSLCRPFDDPEVLRKYRPHVLRGLSVERRLRNEGPLIINMSNIDNLLAQGPTDPVEQANRFLLNLSIKSSEPGIMTSLSSEYHGGLAFTNAIDAFVAMLEFLKAEGFIDFNGRRSSGGNDFSFRLTLEGWRRVAELRQKGQDSTAAFVAMPFRHSFQNLWEEGIKPGLAKAGWRAVRADREHHNDRIDDWIMNQIKSSRFLVVDTTGNNPGACFEAGYAIGLRKHVIWVAREDFVHGKDGGKGLHFDIRQHNHLSWKEGQEFLLSESLSQRVINTVGRGKHIFNQN